MLRCRATVSVSAASGPPPERSRNGIFPLSVHEFESGAARGTSSHGAGAGGRPGRDSGPAVGGPGRDRADGTCLYSSYRGMQQPAGRRPALNRPLMAGRRRRYCPCAAVGSCGNRSAQVGRVPAASRRQCSELQGRYKVESGIPRAEACTIVMPYRVVSVMFTFCI